MQSNNPEPIIRVDELLTDKQALSEIIVHHNVKYRFGKKALTQLIQHYKGYEFSYYNADVFADNLYYNLRWLVDGKDRKDNEPKHSLSNELVGNINNYLEVLGIPYHFTIKTYGSDSMYLRCELNAD